MDFVELVESGKYKKEWLSNENKLIIKGMEVVLELLKDPLLFIKVKNEDFLHLQELVEEVQKKELEAIQKYVYANICEAIVGLYDEEFGTVGGQGCITVAEELKMECGNNE